MRRSGIRRSVDQPPFGDEVRTDKLFYFIYDVDHNTIVESCQALFRDFPGRSSILLGQNMKKAFGFSSCLVRRKLVVDKDGIFPDHLNESILGKAPPGNFSGFSENRDIARWGRIE